MKRPPPFQKRGNSCPQNPLFPCAIFEAQPVNASLSATHGVVLLKGVYILSFIPVFANQKIVFIHKTKRTPYQKCSGKKLPEDEIYMNIGKTDLFAAMKNLSDAGLRLLLYCAANQDGYGFALSQAAVEHAIGLKDNRYRSAKKDLLTVGYFLEDPKRKNVLHLYERPRLLTTRSQTANNGVDPVGNGDSIMSKDSLSDMRYPPLYIQPRESDPGHSANSGGEIKQIKHENKINNKTTDITENTTKNLIPASPTLREESFELEVENHATWQWLDNHLKAHKPKLSEYKYDSDYAEREDYDSWTELEDVDGELPF